MNDRNVSVPLKGYLLLPADDRNGYKGIDRKPFVPTLIEEELDPSAPVQEDELRIFKFYPPGWRRDAYEIYEDNLVEQTEEGLDLLENLDSAKRISQIIHSQMGKHEIYYCEIVNLDDINSLSVEIEEHVIGIDIAYRGGDFYSAIFNGLFNNPAPQLEGEFKEKLNDQGLFDQLDILTPYLQQFREVVVTEKDADFVIYILTKIE